MVKSSDHVARLRERSSPLLAKVEFSIQRYFLGILEGGNIRLVTFDFRIFELRYSCGQLC